MNAEKVILIIDKFCSKMGYRMTTGFFYDERCFWHSGTGYAFAIPVGDLVQPLAAGGLPEDPETKRRIKNLLNVTGLGKELNIDSAPNATREDLERVHTSKYLDDFKSLSDLNGGEVVPFSTTPFTQGGYELASLSSGLVIQALTSVLLKQNKNAYALSRPPGHHCLPDKGMGFCLLANISIAIKNVRAKGLAKRIAVVDWDVHHGNGTEAIFLEDPDVLTISIHQDRCFPPDTGNIEEQGSGSGLGCNMNIPLPAGSGHLTYLEAMNSLVIPKLKKFQPEVIIVACGFDASGVDPLSRMICSAETFAIMTQQLMSAAKDICQDKLVIAHEGGYSEVHVPFCAHAVLQKLSGSLVDAGDPLGPILDGQQPNHEMLSVYSGIIDRYRKYFDL